MKQTIYPAGSSVLANLNSNSPSYLDITVYFAFCFIRGTFGARNLHYQLSSITTSGNDLFSILIQTPQSVQLPSQFTLHPGTFDARNCQVSQSIYYNSLQASQRIKITCFHVSLFSKFEHY